MKRILLYISLFLPWGYNCFAQQLDTFIFQDFEARTISNQKNIGITRLGLNTLKYNTLTDALQSQSALFIKQYGSGALATTSMRGMGAQHMSILWNGIAINSCMNSNIDLNLIPFFFVDNASVETGANSAACGNGTIAGAIHLSNTIEKERSVFMNLQSGSFGYYQVGAGACYKLGKVLLKTRVLYRTAENDLQYHNIFLPDAPLQRQTNSSYVQKGFLQEAELKSGKYNAYKMSLWYLENNRELPSAMGVSNLAAERQYDLNTRGILSHQYRKSEKLTVNNKVAVLYDRLNYYNAYYPTSYSFSQTIIAESEWLYRLNRYNRITTSFNNNYSTARTDGYQDWPTRNMLSLWLRYEWQSKKEKLLLSLGSRLLLVNQAMAPFSPDFAFQVNAGKKIKIKGNAAYSYRVPSFNDYYWLQGGNKDLLPERGFKQELTTEIKQGHLKMTVTAFHHVVNNWILWMPVSGSNFWKAQNAKQVTSQGIELSADYSIKVGQHEFQVIGRYQFVESTNTKAYLNDVSALNKQLTYTPGHSASATFNYAYKKWFAYVTEQYIGSRYSASDNNAESLMEGYLLTNATIGYQLNYKKYKSQLSFTANNIFGVTYQIMENRPTPLRNYQLTLKFNIINE